MFIKQMTFFLAFFLFTFSCWAMKPDTSQEEEIGYKLIFKKSTISPDEDVFLQIVSEEYGYIPTLESEDETVIMTSTIARKMRERCPRLVAEMICANKEEIQKMQTDVEAGNLENFKRAGGELGRVRLQREINLLEETL